MFKAASDTLLRLTNGVTELGGHSITWSYDNTPFETSKVLTRNYIFIMVSAIRSQPRDLQGKLVLRSGELVAQIYTPPKSGVRNSQQIADALATLYERKTLELTTTSSLETRFSTITTVGTNNGIAFRTDFRLPFQFFERRS